jgi:cob(I)alamin adenosyltransferase
VLRYLNRLADLLWILARAAEQGEARSAVPSRSHVSD